MIVCIRAGQCDAFVIEVRNVWLQVPGQNQGGQMEVTV